MRAIAREGGVSHCPAAPRPRRNGALSFAEDGRRRCFVEENFGFNDKGFLRSAPQIPYHGKGKARCVHDGGIFLSNGFPHGLLRAGGRSADSWTVQSEAAPVRAGAAGALNARLPAHAPAPSARSAGGGGAERGHPAGRGQTYAHSGGRRVHDLRLCGSRGIGAAGKTDVSGAIGDAPAASADPKAAEYPIPLEHRAGCGAGRRARPLSRAD